MRRGRAILLLVSSAAVLGVALAWDALNAGMVANWRRNEVAALRNVVQDSLNLAEGDSCFGRGAYINDGDWAEYFRCGPTKLMTGLVSDQNPGQCGQLLVGGTSGLRDLPFTDDRFRYLIFVADHPADEVRSALQLARDLPLAEYIERYPLNPVSNEAYFHRAPEPSITGLDCEDYSLTRLEYSAVDRPRTTTP
jgi:hypothetical protein